MTQNCKVHKLKILYRTRFYECVKNCNIQVTKFLDNLEYNEKIV